MYGGPSGPQNVSCCPEGTRSHLASKITREAYDANSNLVLLDSSTTYRCCSGEIVLEYEHICKDNDESCIDVCGHSMCSDISYTCSSGWE